MRRMSAVRLGCALLLACALTGCGAGQRAGSNPGEPLPTTAATTAAVPPSPGPARSRRETLSCGGTRVTLPPAPARLTRAGSFHRLASLTRRLVVKGRIWRRGDERLYAGVVCGVRSAEGFATLVARSTLTAYGGRPALRWTSRGGLRHFMWLERPGTAVYIGATPGLAPHIRGVAAGVRAR